MKECPRCHTAKPTELFYRSAARYDGLQAYCSQCQRESSKAWIAAHPDRASAKGRRKNLKHKFGITPEGYDAILAGQGGVCAGCGKSCCSGNRLAVDHDHVTGSVRGLLCVLCNRALGFAQDDPAVLRALADYLDAHAREVA